MWPDATNQRHLRISASRRRNCPAAHAKPGRDSSSRWTLTGALDLRQPRGHFWPLRGRRPRRSGLSTRATLSRPIVDQAGRAADGSRTSRSRSRPPCTISRARPRRRSRPSARRQICSPGWRSSAVRRRRGVPEGDPRELCDRRGRPSRSRRSGLRQCGSYWTAQGSPTHDWSRQRRVRDDPDNLMCSHRKGSAAIRH